MRAPASNATSTNAAVCPTVPDVVPTFPVGFVAGGNVETGGREVGAAELGCGVVGAAVLLGGAVVG